MTCRTTGPNATLAHLKRASLTFALVGIVGVSLAACDQGNPTPPAPTPTSQAVAQATATTITFVATATPNGSTDATTPAPDSATPTPLEESIASPTPPIVSEATPESTDQPVSCALLNLNTVTESELMATIPGFSARMVREFFEYRPYVSIQQFRREIGKYVDQSQVAEYEKYVFVPVSANDSDAETIKQIPGVDDNVAATLIAGRPYASNDAFVDALEAQIPDEQAAAGACYLDANP